MFRRALIFALLVLPLPALAQVVLNGVPSSVTSPGPNGRSNGVPSSVTSPGPHGQLNGVPSSVTSPTMPVSRRLRGGRPVPFGDPHRRHKFVPVPIFYPAYQYATPDLGTVEDQPAPADNASAADDSEALRQAYDRGVQDALARQQQRQDRYGQGQRFGQTADAQPAKASVVTQAEPAPTVDDNFPPTVFVFKDGHKLETKSFAIMGQTLFDFSGTSLKKIQLADLDINATRKVNEELGNTLRL